MADEAKKLEFPTILVEDTCVNCGVRFAIPEYYRDMRKRDHKNYHCPNGHQQHYTGKTDLDTINDQKAKIEELKNVLKLIAEIEVNAIFNKSQLETACQLAKGALK